MKKCQRCNKRPASQNNPDGLCPQCRHLLKKNPDAPVTPHLIGKRTMTEEERFWSYLPPRDTLSEDECWEWTGNLDKDGYGKFRYAYEEGGTKMSLAAHRFSWKLRYGSFPDSETLDHSCENKPCVNPNHLRPMSRQENGERGQTSRIARTYNCCKNGHEFTEENTILQAKGRSCLICHNNRLVSQNPSLLRWWTIK